MSLLRPPTALRALRATTKPFLLPATRPLSTSAHTPINRLRNALYGTALLGAIGFAYIEGTDTRSSLHTYTVPAALRYLFSGDDVSRPGPEAAHAFGLRALTVMHNIGLPLHERGDHPYLPHLTSTLFGHRVNTPLGISAGLDKHGEAIDALYALSPAISMLEIGCVTPRPQPGNEKPRLFRLPTSESLINRYGFNSIGADHVARRLRDRIRRYARVHGLTEAEILGDADLPASLQPGRILAVQIGKNKSTPETDLVAVAADYVECVNTLGKYADVIVVNVSSPNTPGLRTLQAAKPLTQLLGAVVDATKRVERARKPEVVVKVSPDSDTPEQIGAICAAIKASGIRGVIVANTTVRRPEYLTASPQVTDEERRIANEEAGGLSGPVLLPRMLDLVGEFRQRLGPNVEILASGGVRNGADAMAAVERGANGVMAYTSFVYGGVGWFGRCATQLAELNQARRANPRA